MLRKPDDFDWGFSNAYFGNLTLGRQVLETSKKVQAVVSGHTHIGMQVVNALTSEHFLSLLGEHLP